VKYRHSFHAGNFADVHKHVTLRALLRALQRKDKGFLYLDTHAGAGRYDLSAADTHRGAEARHGIVRLLQQASAVPAEEVQDYLRGVMALREVEGVAGAALYPGSPLLAAQALRPQDRGICYEILPPECRALERALGGMRRMRVECADGYKGLNAQLPPRERRALVLIDPPYEDGAEFDAALSAAGAALARLGNAVIAIWYPIKDERTLSVALARAAAKIAAPLLCSELWVYPRDSRVGLNGSVMLIAHPPYQFDERMRVWLPELAQALDGERRGGSAQTWLVAPNGEAQQA
jgi:23S rRNA (adenine2030-N6)-methyltransferase